MKNIILTGMMGCGKSTCGRLLSRRLGLPVIDTDDLVVEKAGMPIGELFAARGEESMRDLETQVCQELSRKEGLIIATGGGLPLREENRTALRSTGTVFFLNRSPEEIYDTMDTSGRPLAQQGRDAFLDRFRQREAIYRAFAHVVVEDFSTPEATVSEILYTLLPDSTEGA